MTAIPYATPLETKNLPFKDRRVSLRVAGIALVLLGTVSGCFSILTPVGIVMSAMIQPRPPAARGAGVAPTTRAVSPARAPAPAPAMAPATGPTTTAAATAPAATAPAKAAPAATAPAKA